MSTIDEIRRQIQEAYPDMSVAQALSGPVAKGLLGELPAYSGRSDYQLSPVTAVMVGSFAVCYSHNRALGEPEVVIVKRGDKGPDGEDRFGVLGGFTDLDGDEKTHFGGEQPAQGAAREVKEETLDNEGKPVLDLSPDRLRIIKTGIDYRACAKGRMATQYNGHAVELTSQEMQAVKAHAQRMGDDAAYAMAARAASNGEVANVIVLPMTDVLAMDRDSFTHPHEYDAIQELATQLDVYRANPDISSVRVVDSDRLYPAAAIQK